ncbi:MAG: aminomethyl-transferring glycine dehydrogenase subunit GcvPA [Candidatus Eremiobacteraeota bacterium]|nr:aminomethyl-transferring glycine dehydrogenase subunit GcvPA [Candidatus Eremiobacteraeota bacterium]
MYTPHTNQDIEAMLAGIGVTSIDELMRVPEAVALREPLQVPPALAEMELQRLIAGYAARNTAVQCTSFIGAGAYRHYVPPVIGTLAMRGEFLTAYTPYQAEVSQGYLQAIYEWQTYIALLTGSDLANASVYDGATALAEAAIMAVNATGRRSLLVSRAVHPNYRAVLRTYARGLELEVDELPLAADGTTDLSRLPALLAEQRYAAVVIQNPNVFGCIDIPDGAARAAATSSETIVVGVVAEALSLAALVPPGEWGAAIVAGEAQSFGVPVAYGGPYVGFIACSKEHMRRIPGRLVGKTVDADGQPAYTLTLQAREQHIRRERATSNICTNQAHCALIATIYLSTLGATGLRACAALNVQRIHELAERVVEVRGFERRFSSPVFNECVLRVPDGVNVATLLGALRQRGILGGVDLGRWYPELHDCLLMTATELTTHEEIASLGSALEEVVTKQREPVGA